MTECLLSRKVLGALTLTLGVLLFACDPSIPEEDGLSLGSVLQASQGGSLDGGLGSSVATGTTCGKSNDFNPSCSPNPDGGSPPSPDGGSLDVVYSWTAPKSDRYTFTTEGSELDTVLALRSANSPTQELACNDDIPPSEDNYANHSMLEVDLVRGQRVLVVVDSYAMSCGNYSLGISAKCGGCDTPPSSCHQPAGTCQNGTCVYALRPAGSACNDGNACTTGDTCNSSGVCAGTAGGCGTTELGSSVGTAVAQGNTCGRANGVNSTCGSSNASDQSYTWTAPFAGTFTFTTAGSTYDTVLQLHDLTTGASLACNDDVSGTAQSLVSVALSAGQRIRITVDGFGTSCGNFTLNIQGSTTTKRGLTWVQDPSDSCGQTRVTCNECDPYQGDTSCTESRPLLCIKKDGSSNCGPPSDFYDGWTAGTVALTPFLVRGTELTSLAAANTICANTFGTGYRMAEFHDGGGGWGWRAKGTISPLSTPSSTHPRSGTSNRPNRFWVHINDQPANCWN